MFVKADWLSILRASFPVKDSLEISPLTLENIIKYSVLMIDLLGHELQGASLMNGGETSRPLQLGLKFIWPNALNQSFHMELLSAHRVPGAVPGVQPQQSKD